MPLVGHHNVEVLSRAGVLACMFTYIYSFVYLFYLIMYLFIAVRSGVRAGSAPVRRTAAAAAAAHGPEGGAGRLLPAAAAAPHGERQVRAAAAPLPPQSDLRRLTGVHSPGHSLQGRMSPVVSLTVLRQAGAKALYEACAAEPARHACTAWLTSSRTAWDIKYR